MSLIEKLDVVLEMRERWAETVGATPAAAAMGADFSIPRRAVPERDKRTPDDAAERMAAAEAKRQRKAAKRLRLVPEADSGGEG